MISLISFWTSSLHLNTIRHFTCCHRKHPKPRIRILRICALVLLILLALSLFYYYWPVSIDESVTVWNINGEEATIEADFKVHRRILWQPKYSGSIYFDGIRYDFPVPDYIDRITCPLGIEDFFNSLRGDMVYHWPLREPTYPVTKARSARIWFSMSEWDPHIQSVSLYVAHEDEQWANFPISGIIPPN